MRISSGKIPGGPEAAVMPAGRSNRPCRTTKSSASSCWRRTRIWRCSIPICHAREESHRKEHARPGLSHAAQRERDGRLHGAGQAPGGRPLGRKPAQPAAGRRDALQSAHRHGSAARGRCDSRNAGEHRVLGRRGKRRLLGADRGSGSPARRQAARQQSPPPSQPAKSNRRSCRQTRSDCRRHRFAAATPAISITCRNDVDAAACRLPRRPTCGRAAWRMPAFASTWVCSTS